MEPRPATAADVDEVLRLARVMFAALGIPDTGGWLGPARARYLDGLDDGSVAAFVVDHPDRRGGLVTSAVATVQRRLPTPLNHDGRTTYVQWVATDPEWRGRGLAGAVMTQLVGWARTERITYVDLHASSDGESLYRSMGFAENANPELRLRVLPPPDQ